MRKQIVDFIFCLLRIDYFYYKQLRNVVIHQHCHWYKYIASLYTGGRVKLPTLLSFLILGDRQFENQLWFYFTLEPWADYDHECSRRNYSVFLTPRCTIRLIWLLFQAIQTIVSRLFSVSHIFTWMPKVFALHNWQVPDIQKCVREREKVCLCIKKDKQTDS